MVCACVMLVRKDEFQKGNKTRQKKKGEKKKKKNVPRRADALLGCPWAKG